MSERAPRDLQFGSFSSDPPWIVDRDQLQWSGNLATIRSATLREVPELVKPRRYPPGFRVFRVAWHIGLAMLGWLLIERRRSKRQLADGGDPETADTLSKSGVSRRLRMAAEQLGPTYIKLGQIISAGEGIFPMPLVDEFKKCRDQVPAEDFALVRAVVEEDLGRPLEHVFSSFDRSPLAAASIAQVHRATLASGEEVVVKVQRQTVSTLVHEDIKVMAWVAPFLVGRIPIAALANPPALVELFAQTITEELDFRLEAENMLDIAESLARLGQRGYVIPRPHPELVTRRVLVMERLDGFLFDDIDAMKNANVDTEKVVRTGMIGFMEGCMLHGIFHGDLHGGNLFVMPDGRIALLDFGITGRMNAVERNAFLRLLVGGTMNDIKGQLRALRDLGALPPDTDLGDVIRELGLDKPVVDPTTLTQEELLVEIQKILKALLAMGARMPKILMLFVKNMVFLDAAIANLAPDLDIFEEIVNISTYFATHHGDEIASEVGIDPDEFSVDLDGIRASMGLTDGTEAFTYKELRERREVIRKRLSGHR